MYLVYPPKFCLTICVRFLLRRLQHPGEIENNGYAKWGINKVHYGLCEIVNVKKDHRCYGYTINGAFHNKKSIKSNGLLFQCLYDKQNITWLGPLGGTTFPETFFNLKREISYLQAAIYSQLPVNQCNYKTEAIGTIPTSPSQRDVKFSRSPHLNVTSVT